MANAANKLAKLILISGGVYASREAWINTAILLHQFDPSKQIAVLLEGLPDGNQLLDQHARLIVERIAPGCFCCIGQLAMKVVLNRLLRRQPDYIYIAINDPQHLPPLLACLQSDAYIARLKFENVITL